MRCSVWLIVALISAFPLAAGAAPPDDDDEARELPWFNEIDLNAFVSTAATHNFGATQVGPDTNVGRGVDRVNDTFQLDAATLGLQLKAETPGDAGFRIDLTRGVQLTGDPAAILYVPQAWLSYIVPAGHGLRFDFGTFLSPFGAESLDNYDNYNDTYSRSFLFNAAAPIRLTGIRMRYNITEGVDVLLLGVNGWNADLLDDNTGKSFGAQIVLAALPTVELRLGYLGGPEKPVNNRDWRSLFNAVLRLRGLAPWVFSLDFDYGHEAGGQPTTTQWVGVSGTLRYDFSSVFALAVRAEYYDGRHGVSSPAARLAELTIAPIFKISDAFIIRGEFRQDQTFDGARDFTDHGDPASFQTTAAVNFLFVY